ncbi:hypothetical protein TW95_gp1275 [Pandoravirus inopinatum]|uniref:Uncharacterized protein n=1 Tax=Pandoravirus inopinatum TaxID=1605721 RepID=A0A0B5J340_9VIRU|nr:hypothetical protein TW95_gp1275 [Pandoravirus inopinatum]AJF98009.1 hypothetical protein [Pandoravirus inopinatum]
MGSGILFFKRASACVTQKNGTRPHKRTQRPFLATLLFFVANTLFFLWDENFFLRTAATVNFLCRQWSGVEHAARPSQRESGKSSQRLEPLARSRRCAWGLGRVAETIK